MTCTMQNWRRSRCRAQLLRIGTALVHSLAAGSAMAHHGFGTWDLSRDIEITGTISHVEFVNPHAWLFVDATDPIGQVTTYECEMRGATVLRRSGWTPALLRTGEQVTIYGSPDRNDSNACYLNSIVLADGSTLDRYGQRPKPMSAAAPTAALSRRASGVADLSGDWADEQLVMTDPRGRAGSLVPLAESDGFRPGDVSPDAIAITGTRGASLARALYDMYRVAVGALGPIISPWQDQPVRLTALGRQTALPPLEAPMVKCAPTSIIFDWYIETVVNRIEQSDTTVTIEYGLTGLTRVVDLTLREHPNSVEPSLAGHSIGWFEGDTLVVDTIGFTPGMLAFQVAHGSNLHVVERFSIDATSGDLRREYVAEDADYFIGPYRGTDSTPRSETPFVVDPCSSELNPLTRTVTSGTGGER